MKTRRKSLLSRGNSASLYIKTAPYKLIASYLHNALSDKTKYSHNTITQWDHSLIVPHFYFLSRERAKSCWRDMCPWCNLECQQATVPGYLDTGLVQQSDSHYEGSLATVLKSLLAHVTYIIFTVGGVNYLLEESTI